MIFLIDTISSVDSKILQLLLRFAINFLFFISTKKRELDSSDKKLMIVCSI